MRKALMLAFALAVAVALGVYFAASAADTFGWGDLKAHLLGLGAGAFVVLYVIGGAASLFLGTPSEGPKRK
jgi:hypothetical protein